MVPVHVVAGFLGAGKTTVVRRLLTHLGQERVGLVVNDFGEAAIDRELLSSGGDIKEIRGSCVCCTAPEGFVAALGDLLADGAIDRVLVEPTGLARPADIIDTLRRAPYSASLDLRPLIVVVDPGPLARGEVPADLLEQAAVADVLVANHLDHATPQQVDGFRAWVASLWPGPRSVHEVRFGDVPATVLDPMDPRDTPALAPGNAHGFEVRTLRWPPDVVFHRARLLAAMERFEGARAKGIFRTEEGTSVIQVAGGRVSEQASDRRSNSRVDLIVATGAVEALSRTEISLQAARLRPDEVLARGTAMEVAMVDGRTRTFDRASLTALPEGIADVSMLLPGRQGQAARLDEVLRAAGADGGEEVVVVAADGYVTPAVPRAAMQSAVLLHSLDGGPLPDDKGGPFRLLIPGDAGAGGPCANVKAVVRIALR